MHRIREGFMEGFDRPLPGPVEVDETYIGGKRNNMSNALRRILKREGAGRGGSGKAIVVGVKDRATNQVRSRVVGNTLASTLQGFIADHVNAAATVYTDESRSYASLPYRHEAVRHSTCEYVRGAGPHQRHRELLEPAQAEVHRHLPLDERQAPAPLREGVLPTTPHQHGIPRAPTRKSKHKWFEPPSWRACKWS